MSALVDTYNTIAETHPRRNLSMGGGKVAFAPSVKREDTSLETTAMVFGAAKANATPRFLPVMTEAHVDVPAVRQIAGSAHPTAISFDQKYLAASGTVIGNHGDVFAYVVNKQVPVGFSPEKTGGLMEPNFDISALSRAFGPIGGDPSKFANGTFEPKNFFKSAKLLGVINLGMIDRGVTNLTEAVAGDTIPRLKTIRTIDEKGQEVFRTTYAWSIGPDRIIEHQAFSPKPGASFFVNTTLDRPVKGGAPVFSVKGGLTQFTINLLPGDELVKLHFKEIDFAAGRDGKVDFSVVFEKMEFVGPLRFVQALKDVIPMDGFKDPPFLEVITPPNPRAGVHSGFTLGIPTVGIGIFTLQNISFSAGFYLPFIGPPPNLRLAFCERHQPFTLTVTLFGGGGFFAIDLGLDRVTQIEAALEFGAAVALNLGVAKGAASVMGGVYYKQTATGFAISAYFRTTGSLSVLGIITVSVEFYLALNYESVKANPHGGKLWGQASLTVKVKIAFFSTSVKISIEQEFAGTDPTFTKALTPGDWEDYCNAFAAYPA
jgi:hypothetical protein